MRPWATFSRTSAWISTGVVYESTKVPTTISRPLRMSEGQLHLIVIPISWSANPRSHPIYVVEDTNDTIRTAWW